MKKFFYLLLLCLCIAPATTSAAAMYQVRSLDTLTPAAAVVGNILHFELCQDIVLPGETLKKGSPVIGTIREVKKAQWMGLPRENNPGDIDRKGSRICQSCAAGNPAKLFCTIFLVRRFHKR